MPKTLPKAMAVALLFPVLAVEKDDGVGSEPEGRLLDGTADREVIGGMVCVGDEPAGNGV